MGCEVSGLCVAISFWVEMDAGAASGDADIVDKRLRLQRQVALSKNGSFFPDYSGRGGLDNKSEGESIIC